MNRILLSGLALAGLLLAGCEPEKKPDGPGPKPEEPQKISASLNIDGFIGSTADITLKNNGEERTLSLALAFDDVLAEAYKAEIVVDESLIEQYNADNSLNTVLLPETNYTLSATSFDAAAADVKSTVSLSVKSAGLDLEKKYLLPLLASPAKEGDELGEAVFVLLSLRELQLINDVPMIDGKELMTVYYVNIEEMHPGIVADYSIGIVDVNTFEETPYNTGHIVNLREAVVGYDENAQRPVLTLREKLEMVLGDPAKYLHKLQDPGRKVCLCVEGGNSGIGFCNLNDAQISDLVAQIVAVVNKAGLDGVNLWDRNSGYGKEGMPEMNTTSYPKFIKALKEALGSGKILTLTDYEEPTAYFGDTEKTGGIEVGKYLDYAWSGYYSDDALYIVDPYNQGKTGVSAEHPRTPIAGLAADKYGCIMSDKYSSAVYGGGLFDNELGLCPVIGEWMSAGFQNNKMLVLYDLPTHIQGIYESCEVYYTYIMNSIMGGTGENFMILMSVGNDNFPDGPKGYGAWTWEESDSRGFDWWDMNVGTTHF